MSRVLFLAPTVPWPADSGGRIRTSSLLRELAREHTITLWCVGGEQHEEEEQLAALCELCAAVQVFPREDHSVLQRLSGPIQEQWFASDPLRSRLRSLQASEFDLVHVDELCLIRHLPQHLGIPVVQHHHKLDCELAGALRPPGAGRELERQRWRWLEQESVARTRHHVFCCEADAVRFQGRHPGIQSSVVPNGVDTDLFRDLAAPRENGRLLLLGSMDYEPNLRGMRTFLREVWPALRERRPGLQLDLVGRGSPVVPLAEVPAGVHWVGEVSDVRPWLARATALVVPLDVGGGTRLKIVEAAAAACPVITTRVGLEGLSLRPGEHLLEAQTIAKLTAPILECLGDPERAAERARAASEWVRQHYEWRELANELSTTWRRVCR